MNEISRLLKIRRFELKKSITQLERDAREKGFKTTRANIYNWERGTQTPDMKSLPIIRELYSLDPLDIHEAMMDDYHNMIVAIFDRKGFPI